MKSNKLKKFKIPIFQKLAIRDLISINLINKDKITYKLIKIKIVVNNITNLK